MLDVTYKKRGLRINALWFCENAPEAFKNSRADIVFFHGVPDPGLKGGIVIPQKTLITDLRPPPEDIFGGIGSHCRKRIRRAQREDLTFRLYSAGEIAADTGLLASFKCDYTEFADLKGIENTYNDAAVGRYVESGGLMLSKVTQGEACYAQHIMVCDGKTARGLYSVSRFRTEGLDKTITPVANRFLRWEEIVRLHELHYETYDWAGLTSSEDPNGVDAFKLEFKGQPRLYYNVIVGKSALGKAAVFALKRSGKKLYGV